MFGGDVPTVKFLDGAAHQRGWNIVKQEGKRTGEGTDHTLASKRNHLNADRHRRSPCWNRVGEQSDTVLEQCRGRIFVAVDKEPNEVCPDLGCPSVVFSKPNSTSRWTTSPALR